MEGKRLRFNPQPVYLGVTLDRSLTFGPHLKNVAEKTSKRVNIIRKLTGVNWGANFMTLRTSVLALVYSAAEYAAAGPTALTPRLSMWSLMMPCVSSLAP